MKRPVSKAVILAILFAVGLLAVIIYSTVGLGQYECEVCMEIDGRTNCKKVKGENQSEATQTAKDNACSEIANGRSESVRCSQSAPTSVKCKHL